MAAGKLGPRSTVERVINGGEAEEFYLNRDGKLSHTDMWRTAGTFTEQQPAKWREMEGTKAFVSHVANVILRKSEDEAFQVDRGGREPGTWAHSQIGLAYGTSHGRNLGHEADQWLTANFAEWGKPPPTVPG